MYDFTAIELRDPYWGDPLLSLSKCRQVYGYTLDNGRILDAFTLETTITDVDWGMLCEVYRWQDAEILDLWHARYGYLPDPLRNLVIEYYKRKTELKDVAGQELMYGLSKALLNSIYGMMAQDVCKRDIVFNGIDFDLGPEDISGKLQKQRNRAYSCYSWGVWVTAWARRRLFEGIKIAGYNFVYCDTDSVKFVDEADFTDFNRQARAASEASGAYATDPAGNTHYMGVYELDGDYEKFRSWGSKKYCYIDNGKLKITVAGVSKSKGAQELAEGGGIEAFKPDYVFVKGGGLEAKYNDNIDMWLELPTGGQVHITDNIYLKPSTYTLSDSVRWDTMLSDGPAMDDIMHDFYTETFN